MKVIITFCFHLLNFHKGSFLNACIHPLYCLHLSPHHMQLNVTPSSVIEPLLPYPSLSFFFFSNPFLLPSPCDISARQSRLQSSPLARLRQHARLSHIIKNAADQSRPCPQIAKKTRPDGASTLHVTVVLA